MERGIIKSTMLPFEMVRVVRAPSVRAREGHATRSHASATARACAQAGAFAFAFAGFGLHTSTYTRAMRLVGLATAPEVEEQRGHQVAPVQHEQVDDEQRLCDGQQRVGHADGAGGRVGVWQQEVRAGGHPREVAEARAHERELHEHRAPRREHHSQRTRDGQQALKAKHHHRVVRQSLTCECSPNRMCVLLHASVQYVPT